MRSTVTGENEGSKPSLGAKYSRVAQLGERRAVNSRVRGSIPRSGAGVDPRVRNGPYEMVVAPAEYPGTRYRGKYVYETEETASRADLESALISLARRVAELEYEWS